MANIRSTHAETPAAFPIDQHVESRPLEPFLWKLLLLSAMAYFVWNENISIDIGFCSIRKSEISAQLGRHSLDFFGLLGITSRSEAGVRIEDEAFDNLTFAIDPGYARRYQIDEVTVGECRDKCRLFVKRYSPVAIAEMRRYRVPASILLAQSLLASNAGCDIQAQTTHNFFLRSCEAPACKLEHQGTDEASIDVFPNLWGSFRAQSLFFKNADLYTSLFENGTRDPRTWARALDAAGYSTDPQYGAKLLSIIQSMKLDAFDAP